MPGCLIVGYFLFIFVRCQSSEANRRGTSALVHTDVEAPNDGDKMIVYVGMLVQSIGNFDTRKMSVDVDYYLHMSWTDPRLVHNRPKYRLVQDYDSLNKMWLPDLYMVNAKWSKFHTVSTPNFSVWIRPNGDVAYSVRVTCGVSCPLNLIEYPLDEQICEIKLMSYGHTLEELEFKWFENEAVKLSEGIELPELAIVGHGLDTCNYNFSYAKTAKNSLAGLIVVISWVSFWIDRNAVPARVTLSFTTLLTLSTMAAGVRFSLPPVSYAKAIDIWMGACTFLVFGALLEFAVVNSYSRDANKSDKKCEKLANDKKQLPVRRHTLTGKTVGINAVVDTGCCMAILREERNHLDRKALRVDEVARILFPLMFLIFNICFWMICLDLIPVRRWLNMREY